MNILKISFQYSTYNGKETTFRAEMDKTTSSKQTRSSNVRKEIKTLVIFRMLFAYVSLESIVFSYSELFITNVTPCFLGPVPSSHSVCYVLLWIARS